MTTFTFSDHQYMAKAIKLAKQGHFTTSPNPRVGCVIVKNDEVLGQGFHQKAGQGHAEVNAIADAKSKGKDIQGATVYVTLEPCSHFGRTPPCSQALIDAGVAKVISAMVDPNPQVSGRGLAMLKAAGIEAYSGLLAADAKALNTGFLHLMENNRPYLRCKLAASLDGKTAMASGESKWITGAEARSDVQKLRAQSCAIISGANSVIFDNAKMNVRYHELKNVNFSAQALRQPTRVVIDGKHRITPELTEQLALFSIESPILLIREFIDDSLKFPNFVEQVAVTKKGQYLDLTELLNTLGKRGFNDILLESGACLAGAFMAANLVDELILYQAPKLLGADSKSLLQLPELTALKDAKNLQFSDVTMVGKDIKITAQIIRE